MFLYFTFCVYTKVLIFLLENKHVQIFCAKSKALVFIMEDKNI